MITKKYVITGMHCVSCSMLIEGELEDRGVTARADYKKQRLEVTYDEKNIQETEILSTVSKLGYSLVPDVP